jgi:diaminohydroxyphosphoribosylaminopyrimidine deaminase/5-amino-6-(5-phosphoribosylamino)uracil reductase
MARALQLAGQGMYSTRPNPRVGCVIVKDNAVIGEGWHVRTGSEHAEVIALKQAGNRARGATCYTSLEPCVHTGKTPPCTGALIEAGVANVIAAMVDPNPKVAGKGIALLKQSGIEVSSGLLESEAAGLNPGFIKRMRTGLPHVRCKIAMSLDGKVALKSGVSKWISGEQARADAQYWRARSCAVLTGTGTILIDDPRLTVRDIREIPDQPVRVVLDRRLRTPAGANLFRQPGKVMIFTQSKDKTRQVELAGKGAEVVSVDGVDFAEHCLRYLAGKLEVNEVLVEAGPTLAGELIRLKLVDELIIYQAQALLGSAARGLVDLPEIARLEDRINVRLMDFRHVGDDLRFIYRLND